MKKTVILLIYVLTCLSLLSGCTNDKNSSNLSEDSGNAMEVDIDTEEMMDTDRSSDDDGIEYEFKDPKNADGIEVIPKE